MLALIARDQVSIPRWGIVFFCPSEPAFYIYTLLSNTFVSKMARILNFIKLINVIFRMIFRNTVKE